MKIAICTDIAAFGQNRILDPDYAKNYPGAEAVSELAKLVKKENIEIVTADVALANINGGFWEPEEINLIVEADSSLGFDLFKLGGKPKILQCFESPIFAWPFYDKLQTLAPQFEHRILFKGAFERFNTKYGHNHPAHFPIFHRDTKFTTTPWNQRKDVVLVAANKYWKKNSFPFSLKPEKYRKWWKKLNSATLKDTLPNELQSKRFEIIEFFASQNKIDIFGRQWQKLDKLPSKWQKRLAPVICRLNPQHCKDKIQTMSNYKFAVCLENVAYPGYVTEKIIDCLVAGVIPLYLGTPDIADFIPQNTFINVRNFENFRKLNEYIKTITENDAIKMINAGRDFLNSPAGQKYTYESSAEFTLGLLKKD